MFRLSAVAVPVVVTLALGSASCAAGSPEPGDRLIGPTIMNDPDLEAAAASARPWLEESFADSFAGIELNHEEHVMIVYRRPDPLLDAQLARRVDDVRVTTSDATYSLTEMMSVVERVLNDTPYWRTRNMVISAVGPATDGSGLVVSTPGDPDELAEALTTLYVDMTFDVQRQSVVLPVMTSPPPVLGQTP